MNNKPTLTRSEEQDNSDNNLNKNKFTQFSSGMTNKFNQKFTKSSGESCEPWSANTMTNTTGNEDVEISCFNLGPSKVSNVSSLQQSVALHQLEQYIQDGYYSDALLYLQEFEDIDWVKHQSIIQILEIISKLDKDEIKQHILFVIEIILTKQYLVTKQIIKQLFSVTFKLGYQIGYSVSEQIHLNLDKLINNFENQQFLQSQQQYLPLILYSHAYQLMQWQKPQDCWALLYSKIQLAVPENIKEDWEKTIQKISEILLRNLIENSRKQGSQYSLIEEVLNYGVKLLRPNDIFFNKLIDFSFKHKQVAIAELLYNFMTQVLCISPTIVTINTLIDQYFKNNMMEKAWQTFESLKTTYSMIKADNFTYTTLINGLKSTKDLTDLKKAFILFDEYKQLNNPDQIIYNCLLDACINAGDLDRAYNLLDEMKQSKNISLDEITYNTLIKGCGRKKRLQDAIHLFEEMKEMNIIPNRISFNSLLDSCVKCNKMNIAWKYYDEMTRRCNTLYLINILSRQYNSRQLHIQYSSQWDELMKAIQLLEQIQETGQFKADEILYNSLIDACVKFNEINKSLQLFGEMKKKHIEPSSVTYGILIKAYGKINNLPQAFQIFEEMKEKKVSINDVTYGCLVDACIKNDQLERALALIEQMKKEKISLNTVLYTTLIKGFARQNQIEESLKLFTLMKTDKRTYPNLITYNSLLDGLVKCGRLEDCSNLFNEMLNQKLRPDLITFSTMLKGYCKKGNMKKVNEIVSIMIQYKIVPDESLLLLMIDSCIYQQQYMLGIQIFDQFCQNTPHQSQLLLSALKLYCYGKQLNNSMSLVDKLLILLEDCRFTQQQKNIVEQTCNLIMNQGLDEEMYSKLSNMVYLAQTKYEIYVQNVDKLVCIENQDGLELIINQVHDINVIKNLLNDQNLKASVEIMIKAHIRKTDKDPLNEQFGKIFQSCSERNSFKECSNVLRNVQYKQENERKSTRSNKQHQQDENYNYGNNKENNYPVNRKKTKYVKEQNDLCDYLPRYKKG